MSDQEIRTNTIQFPNGDLQINAYLAQPIGEGPFPAIIIFQEIFGVNAHIRDVTERIAKEGYVAIAPNIYQRIDPNFETGYTPDDVQLGKQYKAQTTATELLSDTQAAIAYLRNLPQVKGDAIGCIGFCFGGHIAYLAATLPDIKVTASFYGAGITTMTPGGGQPTLTRTSEIQGTLYAFFGDKDASIPAEQVEQIAAELATHQVSHQIFRYPDADHGFFCDQRASYNPDAAADAWNHAKQLFQEIQSANPES
jgi:carboxymethylenebutenolidase